MSGLGVRIFPSFLLVKLMFFDSCVILLTLWLDFSSHPPPPRYPQHGPTLFPYRSAFDPCWDHASTNTAGSDHPRYESFDMAVGIHVSVPRRVEREALTEMNPGIRAKSRRPTPWVYVRVNARCASLNLGLISFLSPRNGYPNLGHVERTSITTTQRLRFLRGARWHRRRSLLRPQVRKMLYSSISEDQ